MLGMLKRHEIKVLLKAGHSQAEVAKLAGVSVRSVKRVAKEGDIDRVDDAAERRVGRPPHFTHASLADPLAEAVMEQIPAGFDGQLGSPAEGAQSSLFKQRTGRLRRSPASSGGQGSDAQIVVMNCMRTIVRTPVSTWVSATLGIRRGNESTKR
jgi:hypothetical protein